MIPLIALCGQVKREARRPAGSETDGSSEWKGANFSFFLLLLFSHSLHVLHMSAPYHAASAAMRDELAISAGPGTAVYSAE